MACGISRQAVYQWMEVGANSIDGSNLVELAELSGYNARWIANSKGVKTRTKTDEEQLILDAFPLLEAPVRSIWLSSARDAIENAKPRNNKAA